MGMNKKQREAAARLAEATPAVTPVVEQPIAAEQQAVAAPVAEPAAPAEPVAEATPAAKPVLLDASRTLWAWPFASSRASSRA